MISESTKGRVCNGPVKQGAPQLCVSDRGNIREVS